MDKHIQRLDESHAHLMSLCKKMHILFTLIFAAYSIFAVVYVFAALVAPFFSGIALMRDALTWIDTISTVLSLAIFGLIIFVVRSVFQSISVGHSPFTRSHTRQIVFVGWLFVIEALLGIVVSPDFASILHIGAFDFGYTAEGLFKHPIVLVDLRGIVSAIICFVLSVVWRYGTLLQNEADDLM